jgi:hypothetical protein
MLSYSIKQEAAYPSRPKLLRRLTKIEESAQLVMREMSDRQMRALLLNGDVWIKNEIEMYHGLCDIAARAASYARTPRKQGRGQLYPPAAIGLSSKELCALIVSMMHHRLIGEWLAKGSAKSHRLCEDLWKAAGGTRRGWSDSLGGWRNQLRTAERYRPPDVAGIHIQRILEPARPKRPRIVASHGNILYDHPSSRDAIKQEVGKKKR